MTDTPLNPQQLNAQAINEALMAAIALIDADADVLYPYGQPPILSSLRGSLMVNGYKIAENFDLPWDGPTFPMIHPAPPAE